MRDFLVYHSNGMPNNSDIKLIEYLKWRNPHQLFVFSIYQNMSNFPPSSGLKSPTSGKFDWLNWNLHMAYSSSLGIVLRELRTCTGLVLTEYLKEQTYPRPKQKYIEQISLKSRSGANTGT